MPNLIVAGTTDVSAAIANRYAYIGGSKQGCVIFYAVVQYNGSAWVVNSGYDSAGITTGGLSFASGALTVSVASAGYTVGPVPFVSPVLTSHLPSANTVDANNIQIIWRDFAGTQVTTASTSHIAAVMVIGV
jgi:hypothetical protein